MSINDGDVNCPHFDSLESFELWLSQEQEKAFSEGQTMDQEPGEKPTDPQASAVWQAIGRRGDWKWLV